MKTGLLTLFALAAAAAAPARGSNALPFVEGPDVPTMTAPAKAITVFSAEPFDGCAGKVVATKTIEIPAGVWDRVIVELTGTPAGDPWDRLFSVSIGGVEILRGTTPRAQFTLRRDITEYASLLPAGRPADVSLNFGTYVGQQLGTVTLEFYANEPTSSLVRPPYARALGVFNLAGLTGDGKRIVSRISFPDTAPASATVDLTLSNHGNEEAQFANRSFSVLVDGREIALARAMPYTYAILGFGASNANTACSGPAESDFGKTVHPLMWWTAQRAADLLGVHNGTGEIPPYRAEIDAADLALLQGARTVEVVQQGGRAVWITSLSFLLR